MKKKLQTFQILSLAGKDWGWVFPLLLLLLSGCSKDHDNNDELEGRRTGDKMLITVVFAPGQLGDMGYADNVLEGLFRLKELDHQLQPDSLDVKYITGEDIDATKEALDDFYYNIEDTYNGDLFKRRLLVLTEPFMLDWIVPEKKAFDERDEILVLKMNKDDVSAAAQLMDMGNRFHGLNISAASSARRYCKFIQQTIAEAKENSEQEMEEDENDEKQPELNCDEMLFFRLYEPDKVAYRDSIYEVLSEELGSKTNVTIWSMATKVGDGIFSDDGQTSILQEAFKCGQAIVDNFEETGSAFSVADLGGAAQGLNYFFLGYAYMNIQLLTLDTQITTKLSIRRDFGTAFYRWCVDWMRAAKTGTMPAIQEFGGWNSNYVTDNISLDDDFIEGF